ncbi:MAG: cell filamentation protein Fic [Candidatus Lambdaproteobacteria bacterium RIFOXYD2_FULL_50_16]|uniref:Cell filamentation protein Fic n=1 Tax=Candidatus Lambdaproteobacteria bacterium RIFOXYD2_FULL_50_16 TaxID=1817772 RepID=A0A1F6GE04_9PROT|nr:MAG: cell filamentation protein Fic [Candidatus Lambdaproteobacteria bacterium RIFOXYD2_FULL_50_16]
MRYIHELPTWPNFTWDTEALSEKLAAVRHRQGRLIGRMEGLGFSLKTEASLQYLTTEILKSNEIEGHQLNRESIRSSIARRIGLEVATLSPPDREVEGLVEMMLDATGNYSDKLSASRLYGWHSCLFPTGRSGLTKICVGKWRGEKSGPMQVVSGPMGRERIHFEAPAASRLRQEMKRFITWCNSEQKMDGVIKAAVVHLWFVTIHPFEDGNGRIARALTEMQLARSEACPQRFYSMSNQIAQERNAYYQILEQTQKGDPNITAWITWFLDCLDRAFTGAEDLLGNVLQKARFWERFGQESLNPRQRTILNRLLDGFEGKLTSSKWAKLGKCSQDTATRDINDLVLRGLLTKNKGGGRSTSYAIGEVE